MEVIAGLDVWRRQLRVSPLSLRCAAGSGRNDRSWVVVESLEWLNRRQTGSNRVEEFSLFGSTKNERSHSLSLSATRDHENGAGFGRPSGTGWFLLAAIPGFPLLCVQGPPWAIFFTFPPGTSRSSVQQLITVFQDGCFTLSPETEADSSLTTPKPAPKSEVSLWGPLIRLGPRSLRMTLSN